VSTEKNLRSPPPRPATAAAGAFTISEATLVVDVTFSETSSSCVTISSTLAISTLSESSVSFALSISGGSFASRPSTRRLVERAAPTKTTSAQIAVAQSAMSTAYRTI
jgi:hypothetical protein